MKAIMIGSALFLAACAQPFPGINLSEPNAWATDRAILVTDPLVEMIDTRGELTFLMAHEAGHVLLGHPYKVKEPSTLQRELAADGLAFKMMRLADRSVCSGVSAMRKTSAATGNVSIAARLLHWAARFPECGHQGARNHGANQ